MKQAKFFVLAAAVALFASCGSDKKKDEVKPETPPNVPVVKANGLKIAFYYQDSLKSQFEIFKKEEDRINKRTKEFQNQMIAKENQLRRMGQELEAHVKNGTLLPDQLGKLEKDFYAKQQSFATFQQQQAQKLDEDANKSLTALGKKVEAASKKYCEKYGLDILMIQAPGGQIGFINPSMDVTKSFIEFLNNEEKKIDNLTK